MVPAAEGDLIGVGIKVGSGVGRAVCVVIEYPAGKLFGDPEVAVVVRLKRKALRAVKAHAFVPAEMTGDEQPVKGLLDGNDGQVKGVICLRLIGVVSISAACALLDDHALGAEAGEKVLVGKVVELGFWIAEGEKPFIGFNQLRVGAGLFERPVHAVGAEKQKAAGNDDGEDGERRADELGVREAILDRLDGAALRTAIDFASLLRRTIR